MKGQTPFKEEMKNNSDPYFYQPVLLSYTCHCVVAQTQLCIKVADSGSPSKSALRPKYWQQQLRKKRQNEVVDTASAMNNRNLTYDLL
jgi:hypothetical protein